ncbi:protein phosphatase [Sphingomonas oleivorans]|uniref:Protein phosphatase n=1 Tax=Sphingomonas oleivorans TaxID=1735121 RepID=A0A2T5FXB7_9SPHN|nr:bifunctional protein-serine/threonine kinase/phosphatase [Sphingomonas oleivorans]PTQ10773.1 protein phosphatase [Sphingomonas oleivorans]
MRPEGRLEIAAGFATAQGPRPDNQDFGAVHRGSAAEELSHGIIAAVADGVGGAKGGRIAAELAVRSFIEGYPAQSPTIGVEAGGIRALASYNRWLNDRARTDSTMEGAATTFTALVLRGREATLFHVGDSRAWLYRGGMVRRLTQDHVLPQPELRHVLYRALGIEPELRIDIGRIVLEPHDRLLLATDGVHNALSDRALARLLAAHGSPEADAAAIVDAAIAAGTQDNSTVVLIDLIRLPAIDQDAIGAEAERLPVEPPPKTGDAVDGFTLERLLSDGRYSRIFLARDEGRGDPLVLKFPKPALLSESGARRAFLRETLIGRRVESPFVGGTIAIAPERQSRLYIAMPFHSGETLEARLTRAPVTIRQGVEIAIRLAKGVAALHRLEVVHRDIKPDNVMLTAEGGLKLIDLGVARLPRLPDFAPEEIPGTPGYMAPELYDGQPGDAVSDQFALGVTLYRMFTGRFPYGEPEAFSRPRFDRPPLPASRHRGDMPAWLGAALLRAVAVNPADRFGDVTELVHVLESGNARAITPRPRAPLIERHPVRFWQGVSLLLALGMFIALAMR